MHFLSNKASLVELNIDGNFIIRKNVLVSVSNTHFLEEKPYTEKALFDDGACEVSLIHLESKLKMLKELKKHKNQDFVKSSFVESYQGKNISLLMTGDSFYLDGILHENDCLLLNSKGKKFKVISKILKKIVDVIDKNLIY